MDIPSQFADLSAQFPGKALIENGDSELLCETEPASEHPEYSVAIAMIDRSAPHYHRLSREIYEVLRGVLTVSVDGAEISLAQGDKLMIAPGSIHSAWGAASWVRVTSEPGWTPSDHYLSA